MLTRLKRIVEEVNQHSELQGALEHVVSQVKKAMTTECCSIYLADHEADHFLLMATDGLSESAVGRVKIGFSQGLVSLVGQREEPVNIADARAHPRFLVAPEVQEDAYNAFLGAPIIHQRKVLGVLSVQQTDARVFTESEVAFLVTLAAQLAAAIAHAEVRQALKQQQDDSHRHSKMISGVPGSAGVAIGQAFVLKPVMTFASIFAKRTRDSGKEIIKFKQAIATTQKQLRDMASRMSQLVPTDASAIFDFYRHMLGDDSLIQRVNDHIHSGWNAATSLKLVIDEMVADFAAMEDDYIRERVTDIKDVGQRLLVNLLQKDLEKRQMPEQVVLIAEEVTASMLAEIPRERLKGVCSIKGSTNSHASILAKALGIPAVMGLEDFPLGAIESQDIIIDGYSGQIYINPEASVVGEYQQLLQEEQELETQVRQIAMDDAQTADGVALKLQMNTGLAADMEYARDVKVDGIGLYRTELPFMVRQSFPTENEQIEIYKNVLSSYPDDNVIMRTLDVGGDKPLPYFPITEDNPFLGWRGIRMTLDHPEILLVQLRAMLKANIEYRNLRILLPMISSVAEVEEAIRLINQVHSELCEETAIDLARPQVGVMLEVPAAIYQISRLSELVDFFSVGTNDLTQYLLAVDRNNARVANLYDYYHPGVLQALQFIIDECQRHERPASVCGEMAGEPMGLLLLLGMGYRNFSMSAHSLLRAKWILRNISIGESWDILEQIMSLSCPDQIREFMILQLEQRGLGGFIRAGK